MREKPTPIFYLFSFDIHIHGVIHSRFMRDSGNHVLEVQVFADMCVRRFVEHIADRRRLAEIRLMPVLGLSTQVAARSRACSASQFGSILYSPHRLIVSQSDIVFSFN